MGKFSDAVVPLTADKTLYVRTVEALMGLGDGSYAEFMSCLMNKDISARAIAVAITSTTEIKVSERTVNKWRLEMDSHGQV